LTAELKKQLRPGLDAIIRWLGAAPAAEERRPPKPTAHQVKKASATKAALPPSTRKPQRATTDGAFGRSGSTPRGPAPKPIGPFPEPLFEATEDPETVVFQTMARALDLEKSGISYSQQHTARPLLTPDEVRNLPTNGQLLFLVGQRPIIAGKLAYYADPEFRGTFDGT